MSGWNPWHGCTKISPGCKNCYVYRRDAEFGKDASVVHKTASFDLPIKKTVRAIINYCLTVIMFILVLLHHKTSGTFSYWFTLRLGTGI